jgi:hypothetical protein
VNKRGLAVAAGIVIFAFLFVAALIASAAGAKSPATQHPAAAGKPGLAAGQSPPSSPPLARRPRLASLVGSQCTITYRARGIASTAWTVTVTASGQLITLAQDKIGSSYRHTARVRPGRHVFTVQEALSQITVIGGVLNTGGTSYGCSVALRPSRHRVQHTPKPRARHTPKPPAPRRTQQPVPVASPPPPPPPPPPTTAACYPLSDEGNCYQPGEFCRDSDHGVSGTDANGDPIVCEDNDGWRWEPA